MTTKTVFGMSRTDLRDEQYWLENQLSSETLAKEHSVEFLQTQMKRIRFSIDLVLGHDCRPSNDFERRAMDDFFAAQFK